MRKATILFMTLLLTGSFGTQRPVHIFMIGDSTMSDKKEGAKPETGWGQVLSGFFTDAVVVDNHAVNGRSSKSFKDEGRWKKVISQVQEGDYVIIQFGHNDQKPDEARHTDPFTTYREHLSFYIDQSRSKGATPILCTSIVRRHFDENGRLIDTHGQYIEAMKQLAAEKEVALIDLEAKTRKLVQAKGPVESKYLYLFLDPGVYPNRPDGVKDSTHLSPLGAYTVASLAVEGMRELDILLTRFLK